MFTIIGGAVAFTQWQKDQKVTNHNMKAGDPVYFAASNGESYPTRAYISGGAVVADVPNELLTMPNPFTVRLDNYDEPVTIFRVEAADKPSGYVYEDNMTKPHVPGDVTIPAGATLRIEEGANFQNYGGASGGGSFIVTATAISTEPGDDYMRIVCESSVRFDEVRANIENNILPTMKLDPGDGGCMFLPLCQFMPNDDTIMFYANIMGTPASAYFTGMDGSENLIVTLGVPN